MGVNVDAAGHHQQAGGVDDRVARGGNVRADLLDGLAVEEHVGAALAVSVDDGAVLDQGRP